ncbi:MAG TPA: carbon-nitrogen hydrolase family protein, partial [Micropepsaceae bacterium]|nr:carbon-nitrogen hydrolase family protein [Micropepsaceae bacterium]
MILLRHANCVTATAPSSRLMATWVAAVRDDVESIVFADLDIGQATRSTALARAAHPALSRFWEAGAKLQHGQTMEAPALTPLKSAATDITLAAAQVADNFAAMEAMIAQARAKHADLVVFPARAIAETALEQFQAAARVHRITVVVGMEHRADGARRNSAFVIGPDGSVLTRYDQLSAASPFQPGEHPSAMWFRVKGVP